MGAISHVLALKMLTDRSDCVHRLYGWKPYEFLLRRFPIFQTAMSRALVSPSLLVSAGLGGFFYLWIGCQSNSFQDSLFLLLAFHLLLMAAVTDLYYWLIPNRLHVFIVCLSVPVFFSFTNQPFEPHLIGAAFGFTMPFLVIITSRGGLGGGDLKLFMTLGWLIGYPLILTTMIDACLAGLLFFLLHLVLKRRAPPLKRLPFAPFILIGYLIVLFQSIKFEI
ncbi:prepilin peptidase [Pullulanibacillus sp. KACC 23026]|uniref:prepilin peptidase n=1 Tax=Pullulanibacillus sp. KACC 23026 TaxID=3028315 RepID=UPI0023B0CC4C|nr:prepilin peptidase [Pullulanibacillus sp. KACC 23026]WEG14048.1 prepilin peptidase [Pullulanibacillus sp. KACC 23026]